MSRQPLASVGDAFERIVSLFPMPSAATLPLDEALGAVLRETVASDRPQPPFHRVAMDGIAIDHARLSSGTREFAVAGIHYAGQPAPALADDGQCFEVATGAVLPTGCDCVVPYEELEIGRGVARLITDRAYRPWQNVHLKGSDCAAGDLLLPAGTRLHGPELAVLASVGVAQVPVWQAPATVLVSTGDELVDVAATPADHQIRRSNPSGLAGLLQSFGWTGVARRHLADDVESAREEIRRLLASHRILVFSGAVSKGRKDFLPELLQELGVEAHLHGVSQRPGKPMWVGRGREGQLVLGLPGNPVSCLVALRRYLIEAWRYMLAMVSKTVVAPVPVAALAEAVEFRPGLTLFLPASLETDATARRLARPRPTNGSGDFAGLALSDGFVELPAERQQFEAGFVAPFYGWRL